MQTINVSGFLDSNFTGSQVSPMNHAFRYNASELFAIYRKVILHSVRFHTLFTANVETVLNDNFGGRQAVIENQFFVDGLPIGTTAGTSIGSHILSGNIIQGAIRLSSNYPSDTLYFNAELQRNSILSLEVLIYSSPFYPLGTILFINTNLVFNFLVE